MDQIKPEWNAHTHSHIHTHSSHEPPALDTVGQGCQIEVDFPAQSGSIAADTVAGNLAQSGNPAGEGEPRDSARPAAAPAKRLRDIWGRLWYM